MPAFAVGARAVLVGVDDHQLPVARRVRGRWMDVQLAKISPEGEVLFRRQVLIAEENDRIFRQCAMDFVHLPVRQRFAQIGARDFGANDRREFVHGNGFVRRRFVRGMTIPRSVIPL